MSGVESRKCFAFHGTKQRVGGGRWRGRALLVGVGVLGLSAFVWAASPSQSGERLRQEDPKNLWQTTNTFLKQGAYRDALQSLEVLLTITPNDPWAQLYRSLCEIRLQGPQRFGQVSPSQLAVLQELLHQEQRDQRRTTAQQQLIERQIRKEQARWDQELKMLQRKAEQEDTRKRQHAQAEAVTRARIQRAQARELAQQQTVRQVQGGASSPSSGQPLSTPTVQQPSPAPSTTQVPPTTQQPVSPTPETSPTTASETGFVSSATPSAASSMTRSVELQPIIVPTSPTKPAEERPAPAPPARPKPPSGAVQLNARQMSVSPDQKIALAEGDVELVYGDAVLTCDRLTLFTDTKDVYAEGRVRLERGTESVRADLIHYNLKTKKGRFLKSTVSSPPWFESGRSVEHIAEGVYDVRPGLLTSCDLEPSHFQFSGGHATVFTGDKFARARDVALFVDRVPLLYLPWVSFSNDQSPFFIIPGKKKPWGPFALMGYRYEWPEGQRGTLKLDWRRYFLWGMGIDHQFDDAKFGKGLVKLYYNEEQNILVQNPKATLPKGATENRYRVLFRHKWQPLPDTTVVTDLQKFSDSEFRKDFLFREEYVQEDTSPDSFISIVTSTPTYSLATLLRPRGNRFQSVDETLPQITFDIPSQRIGDTNLFSENHFDVAEFQKTTANTHTSNAGKAFRMDWFEQLKYALTLFQPIEVTPRAGMRQTLYSKTLLSPDNHLERSVLSGQFSMGVDSSLKLFRIFPFTTNILGLNIHGLRHIVTPTLAYSYVHRPTVSSALVNFAAAAGPVNQLGIGLENKLQTRHLIEGGKWKSVDIGRLLFSIPYTFRGTSNKQGGRLGEGTFKLELYPWPQLRLESGWTIPSHFLKATQDERVTIWNVDLVAVGGRGHPGAKDAPPITAPALQGFKPGPKGGIEFLLPQGEQWYLGLGHRYSQNDKTESIIEFDWMLSPKWEIGTFHRFTWKEVAGGAKRFNNLREYQYSLRRDLHDWMAEFVYQVDREFGEEIFFTLTLKAYPGLPVGFGDSYHQPKFGSQSSPFSPIHGQ